METDLLEIGHINRTDSWKDVPDVTMTIYFVFHEKLEELKSKGMKDLNGQSEGMLNKIPVG